MIAEKIDNPFGKIYRENKAGNLMDELNSLPPYDYSVPKDTILEDSRISKDRLAHRSTRHLFIENENDPIIPFQLNERYEKIYKEFVYLQIYAFITVGVISLLPEGVSKWDKEKDNTLQELLNRHAENVEDGPVWDEDTLAINYIGHTIVGSYYYVWGRQAGLTWQESAILNAMMSTFYWEYGWEAFAETPSIQDLLITPILGSLLGEGTNYLYTKIMQNDGLIYDSVILGSLSRALLNPIGELNTHFDNLLYATNTQINIDYSFNRNIENYSPRGYFEDNPNINKAYFGFDFTFKY